MTIMKAYIKPEITVIESEIDIIATSIDIDPTITIDEADLI